MISRPPAPPLQFAAILQATITLVGRHLGPLVAVALVVAIPTEALALVGGLSVGGTEQHMYDVGIRLSQVAGALTGLLITIAGIEVVRASRDDRPVTVASLLAMTGRWFLPVLGLSVMLAAGVFVGFIALIVPGIYLLIRWAVAVPALVIEEKGIVAAFRSSWSLVDRRWWITCGLIVVGYLIPAIVASLVGGGVRSGVDAIAGDLAWQRLLSNGLASVVISCIGAPFTAVYVALLYFDLVAAGPIVASGASRVAEPGWPEPLAPPVPGTGAGAAGPPPPPPSAPLPGGFLPPHPAPPSRPDGALAPPPERPPAAGD